jgi:molybdate transport system ATP-binding protein
LGEASARAHLEVEFRKRIGALEMDVAFRATAPWTVLFGPSGSGKSTILRVIAGLERADAGRVSVLGNVVADSKNEVWVPAYKRWLRSAGQRAYLRPRKTVKWQMTEGTATGHDPYWAGRAFLDELERLLDHFKLRGLAELRPEALSGGQRQMVSVVRAAAGARGGVLLLDEPFSGLDAGVRDQLIEDLRGWLGNTPVVSVTHDVGEAFLLGAEVVKIAGGRVVAQGPVGEVLAEERKRLVGILGG